jgi:hypothetical protein
MASLSKVEQDQFRLAPGAKPHDQARAVLSIAKTFLKLT